MVWHQSYICTDIYTHMRNIWNRRALRSIKTDNSKYYIMQKIKKTKNPKSLIQHKHSEKEARADWVNVVIHIWSISAQFFLDDRKNTVVYRCSSSVNCIWYSYGEGPSTPLTVLQYPEPIGNFQKLPGWNFTHSEVIKASICTNLLCLNCFVNYFQIAINKVPHTYS